MKNLILISIIAISISYSCNDDFLNTEPLDEVSEEAVWTDPALAEAFIYDIYNGFGNAGFYEQQMASMTDEALFTHPGRGINVVTESRSSSTSQGYIMATYDYSNLYSRIRSSNIAILNLRNPQFDDPEQVAILLGQAYFLRAYYYNQLLRFYGAVPIVDFVYELGDDDYTIARNTYEECVNFIIDDCDSAAFLLKDVEELDGRATDLAALALKSRVLTYAASDLHDEATAKAKSSTISSYANYELLGYTSGSRTDRWQKAKDASFAVLARTDHAYKLDLTQPATVTEAIENYSSIAMGGGSNVVSADGKIDLILGRFFNNLKDESGAYIGLYNGPNGYHKWSGNTPTQLLVDDYETITGEKFNWSNPVHASAPYQNRDPRFYATIMYDGSNWKVRTDDVINLDPVSQIQAGQYEIGNASGTKTIHAGLDTRNSSIEDWNGSYTGYCYRKFTDPDPAIVDQNTRQQIPYPILRYTEAVLNYIEACIELGQEAEARTWLNKIRFRSGMPAVEDTGESLRDRYRNERRVEMAYEEQRFFDARRWMIAATTLGRKVTIISIFGTLKAGKEVSVYAYNTDNYTYTYTVNTLDPGIENRAWLDKMYFTSFHRDEINRNTKLIQNPGYD
ncbi:RagB/SusD family nutrient uptake outer membrane protein [Sphingobacterium hungaricum]|uniref:RagB/SusD family nutrient uptake outer membrane protein n=1 Tax=Sphingobacterium hungaricum TaxID=2082723 RepID=A0A928UWD4_9SPHI|nr:RagB/SusD family nutrient uptake outer membrane protein [Sphingobacterium hungaricum]MBE8712329.1 RagB/SusD family nutrient uptake outer membrane protein [Sphingobacterium hungaricum]